MIFGGEVARRFDSLLYLIQVSLQVTSSYPLQKENIKSIKKIPLLSLKLFICYNLCHVKEGSLLYLVKLKRSVNENFVI